MFFAICGVDGVGKTSVMKGVAENLLAIGIDNFILTKEPGGPIALQAEWNVPAESQVNQRFGRTYSEGPLLREFCVNHPDIPQLAKRALYKADALCNWEYIIKPAIQSDEFIISDRSWVSDLVYGAVLCHLDPHALFQFNMALTPQLHSMSHIICLTASEEVREARLATNVVDHMDKLGTKIRNELAAMYEQVVRDYVRQDQYWFVDTDQPLAAVIEQVTDIVIKVNECL